MTTGALASLGFDVAGMLPKSLPGIETYAGDDALFAFLARTDILVVLQQPPTEGDAGIIDAKLLAG